VYDYLEKETYLKNKLLFENCFLHSAISKYFTYNLSYKYFKVWKISVFFEVFSAKIVDSFNATTFCQPTTTFYIEKSV